MKQIETINFHFWILGVDFSQVTVPHLKISIKRPRAEHEFNLEVRDASILASCRLQNKETIEAEMLVLQE